MFGNKPFIQIDNIAINIGLPTIKPSTKKDFSGHRLHKARQEKKEYKEKYENAEALARKLREALHDAQMKDGVSIQGLQESNFAAAKEIKRLEAVVAERESRIAFLEEQLRVAELRATGAAEQAADAVVRNNKVINIMDEWNSRSKVGDSASRLLKQLADAVFLPLQVAPAAPSTIHMEGQ